MGFVVRAALMLTRGFLAAREVGWWTVFDDFNGMVALTIQNQHVWADTELLRRIWPMSVSKMNQQYANQCHKHNDSWLQKIMDVDKQFEEKN